MQPRGRRRLGRAVVTAVVTAVSLGTGVAAPAAAHGPVPAEAPDAGNLLLGWSFEPVLVLPLLVAAVAWWRLLDAVDRGHPDRPVGPLRRWSFLAGLGAIAVALQSGIERYDTTLFSIHMVQHVLLTLVSPLLLALGAPVTQLLRAASPATRARWILPVLRSRVVAFVSHPVVAWLVFTVVMWATHFSPLFDRSLEDPLVHDLEHGLFLGAGLLFWWPVIGLDPAPRRMRHPGRILYLFLQMPQNSFLAMAILFAGAPLYPHYATLGSPYGIDALADQRLAAGLMWFIGDLVFLAALLAVLAGWMRSEDRGAAAAERRADVERDRIREREDALRRRRAGDLEAGAEPLDQPGTGEVSSSR
ncbi:MAG: cytochrome c oxidase assembly protein [Chloroflexi bacterium]|nr:cytochrome c oxidase assembly protein [Chloroflexota bacterium]